MPGRPEPKEILLGTFDKCSGCQALKQEPRIREALDAGQIGDVPIREVDAIGTEEGRGLMDFVEEATGRAAVPAMVLRDGQRACMLDPWKFAETGEVELQCPEEEA